jgi:hypothetical protein
MRRARLGRTVMAMGLPVKETYYMSKRDLLHEQKETYYLLCAASTI